MRGEERAENAGHVFDAIANVDRVACRFRLVPLLVREVFFCT